MPGGRILVVEDEALIRLMLAETLAQEGFQVVEAASADEAVALLARQDGFAAIVTDIHTPGGQDGIAVGRAARARDPEVPVVYVTGRPDAMHGAGRLGRADAFLRKPYRPSQVVAALRQLLDG